MTELELANQLASYPLRRDPHSKFILCCFILKYLLPTHSFEVTELQNPNRDFAVRTATCRLRPRPLVLIKTN